MKLKHTMIGLSVAVTLLTGISVTSTATVQAQSLIDGRDYTKYDMHTRRVTKREPLYLVKTGAYEAANHFYRHGYIHKGTKMWVSNWLMSTGGGYAVSFAGHHASKHYFYFVPVGEHVKWFK